MCCPSVSSNRSSSCGRRRVGERGGKEREREKEREKERERERKREKEIEKERERERERKRKRKTKTPNYDSPHIMCHTIGVVGMMMMNDE